MNNKYIEELHRIREENYENTKDISFEMKQEKIHQGAMEFLKIIESLKREQVGV